MNKHNIYDDLMVTIPMSTLMTMSETAEFVLAELRRGAKIKRRPIAK